MAVVWSKDLIKALRTAWGNGASNKECGKLIGATEKAIQHKVRQLKIQRPNGRPPEPQKIPPVPSIPSFVRHQAVTDYHGGWNYREQCFDNNHLYREPISLATVW